MTNILYPRNPARILTTAFKMAMAITLALGRDRATGKARPLYFGQGNRIKGMAKVWDEGKRNYQQTVEEGHPDASKLLIAEHNLRRSFSRSAEATKSFMLTPFSAAVDFMRRKRSSAQSQG